MPQPSLIDFLLFAASGLFGWIIVDGFANLLLRKSEKGAKFRLIGARWLTRELAIKVAFVQFGIAFVFSYFIQDYLFFLFSSAYQYAIPIGMTALGALYLYILANLPYKVTLRRCTFSLVLFGLAALLFYAIHSLT
jgi:hypothetical protein